MKIKCEIIQDLIPLVNDKVASQESLDLVKEHCAECTKCASLLEEKPDFNETQVYKKWQKKLRMTSIGILLLFVFLVTSFSGSYNQFQSFIIMPITGALGYGILKTKVYYIYILVLISQCIMIWSNSTLDYFLMMYILVYWFLMTIGIAIYLCYEYAFKGGNHNEN